MATQHSNPPAPAGQNHQATNNQIHIFADWLTSTEQAIDALFVWKSWLRAWQSHPQTGQLPDDLFMSVVQDMNEAGSMAWLDRPELDRLREAVTGGE